MATATSTGNGAWSGAIWTGGSGAAGLVVNGTPDTTNKGLIFDPDSSTVTDTKIKVSFDATLLGGVANVLLHIVYDDSAYVYEAPKEA